MKLDSAVGVPANHHGQMVSIAPGHMVFVLHMTFHI